MDVCRIRKVDRYAKSKAGKQKMRGNNFAVDPKKLSLLCNLLVNVEIFPFHFKDKLEYIIFKGPHLFRSFAFESLLRKTLEITEIGIERERERETFFIFFRRTWL